MYKYVLNSVVKISLMFAQYFDYYALIPREGGIFPWTWCNIFTDIVYIFYNVSCIACTSSTPLSFLCLVSSLTTVAVSSVQVFHDVRT